MPMNEARSAIVHSHSRFWRTDRGRSPPKVSLLTVVSIWKIFTPALRMTSPMRQFEWCRAELWRSMSERECCRVWTLWWWRRLR